VGDHDRKWRRHGKLGGGVEAVLGMTTVNWMGGGGMASDQRRETKEERAEWAAEANRLAGPVVGSRIPTRGGVNRRF
jgi:hypothetical protein